MTVHCTGYGKDRDLNKKFWSTRDPGQNVGLAVETVTRLGLGIFFGVSVGRSG